MDQMQRMSPAQQAMMMEAQADMMHNMMTVCRAKTQKTTHSTGDLDANEKKAMENCLKKFMEAPMHLQSAMAGQQM